MRVEFLIQPNAKKTEFITLHDGKVKIKIASKPIDGQANDELISFLSNKLSIPKSKITILQGKKGRSKVLNISITDIEIDRFIELLK